MVVVAGVLLFKVATLGIAILAMGVSEVLRGGAVDRGLVVVFAALTAIALVAVAHYSGAIRHAPLTSVAASRS